jgi:hypothetical protein
MRKTFAVTIAVLLFVAIMTFGCDRNKGERASLLKQINELEADLTRLNEQRARGSEQI